MIRHVVHHGTVEAAALLVDARLGEDRARERILASWDPGVTVRRMDHLWLVSFSAPRWTDCSTALGLPLTRVASGMAALPLSPAELARHAATGGIVVAEAGRVQTYPLPNGEEDVAAWLDVDDLVALEGESLGAEQPAAIAIPAPPRPMRAVFKHAVSDAPEEANEVATQLAKLAAGESPAAVRGAKLRAGANNVGLAMAGTFALLLAGATVVGAGLAVLLGRVLSSMFGGLPPRASTNTTPARPREPVKEPALLRWMRRLEERIKSALMRTRLAEHLGRRHAEYLSQMMEMFRRGDLSEALRHAIPLGGKGGESAAMLSAPSPRARLDIQLWQQPATSSIGVGEDLFANLRDMYRRAVERLEAEGRVDEAAFVLAELLGADEEAVSFLERHGRLRMAAELAEARDLAPGLIVRQWFLAGDLARAIRVARKFQAFGDAVRRLERSHAREAESLRMLWADALASAGFFGTAVDVAWNVSAGRALVKRWIELGIEQTGPTAARLLVSKLQLDPTAFQDVHTQAATFLYDGDSSLLDERLAFAEKLATVHEAHCRPLAEPTVRALFRDAAAAPSAVAADLIPRLAANAAEDSLRTDLPKQIRASAAPTTLSLDVAAHDVGRARVFDAAVLPRGKFLVALGERGTAIVSRDGEILAEIEQAADRLIPSNGRDRAITVARRGSALRLGRVDVGTRKNEPWAEAELGAWASDFDGEQWVVARGSELLVLDAMMPGLDALHRLDVRGVVERIARSGNRCSVLVRDSTGARERWLFSLPEWRMWGRGAAEDAEFGVNAVAHDGTYFGISNEPGPDGRWAVRVADGRTKHLLAFEPAPDWRDTLVAADDRCLALVVCTASGVRIRVEHHLERREVAQLVLGGATTATVRFDGALALIADDRGRLLAIDTKLGTLVRNLRIG
jgi:hypothetical protein